MIWKAMGGVRNWEAFWAPGSWVLHPMSGFSLSQDIIFTASFLTWVHRWPLPMIWWFLSAFSSTDSRKLPSVLLNSLPQDLWGKALHREISWITCQAIAGLPRSDLSSGFRGVFPVLADAAYFWGDYGWGSFLIEIFRKMMMTSVGSDLYLLTPEPRDDVLI